jgi:hypothetical protein
VKKIIAILALFIVGNVVFSQDTIINDLGFPALIKGEIDIVQSKFNFEVAAGLDRSREISNFGYSAVANRRRFSSS